MGYREGDHLVFRDDLLRAVEELGGQLLFFMHITYWDKTLEERWLDYFKSEFKPNKKFYIIFEESEFSTHTLLDLDLIVDFFKKRDVNKDKLIWMVPAHNFTDLVNRYNEYIVKKPNLPVHYGDSRFSGYKHVKEYVSNTILNNDIKSVGFNMELFFAPRIAEKKFLDSIKTIDVPNKLFSCPMGLKKESRVRLLKEFKRRKFIKSLYEFDDDDLGWVSANWSKTRIFEGDVDLFKGKSKTNIRGEVMVDFFGEEIDLACGANMMKHWPMMHVRSYCMRKQLKDSFFIVNVECQIGDYSIWGTNEYENDHLWGWLEIYGIRFSEKTSIPFLFKKPFFNMGPVNGLEVYKSYGFKTFSRWINEEYDKQTDSNVRIKMILDELERLSKFTQDELIEMTNEMNPILEHNHQLLLDHIKNPYKYLKNYIRRSVYES